jgi:hypothetical protein
MDNAHYHTKSDQKMKYLLLKSYDKKFYTKYLMEQYRFDENHQKIDKYRIPKESPTRQNKKKPIFFQSIEIGREETVGDGVEEEVNVNILMEKEVLTSIQNLLLYRHLLKIEIIKLSAECFLSTSL